MSTIEPDSSFKGQQAIRANQDTSKLSIDKVASISQKGSSETIHDISRDQFPKGDENLVTSLDPGNIVQKVKPRINTFSGPNYKYIRAIKGQDIYLIDIDAKGGGANAFLELIKERQNLGLTGDIYLVTHSSEPNLFYLYMGMVPYEMMNSMRTSVADIQIDYMITLFPNDPQKVNLAHTILDRFEKGEDLEDADTTILKEILQEETKKSGSLLQSDITDDDLIKNKEILLDIKNKQVSKLEGEFIPLVLKDMENSIGNKRIRLPSTHTQYFKMTKEGFERAEKAIANGESKIKPFKMLEHLPMNQAQRLQLENIMKKRKENV